MSNKQTKYRAWCNLCEKMIPMFETKLDHHATNEGEILISHHDNHLCTALQFTGLLDENGKEIYESDIVQSEAWAGGPYTVAFNRGGFCFYEKETDDYYHDCKYLEDFEVIGNIYSNPELLPKD